MIRFCHATYISHVVWYYIDWPKQKASFYDMGNEQKHDWYKLIPEYNLEAFEEQYNNPILEIR